MLNKMPDDAHSLARAVARLNRRLRQERRSDLTPTQLSILGTVSRCEPATPGHIAAEEGVKPPSVTRILNQLAEADYVSRIPHPQDGRQVLVQLSEYGRERLEAENQRRNAWLQEQLEVLDVKDRALLRDAAAVLARLAETR